MEILLPGAVFIIVVFDIPAGELVVKSIIVLPRHPICAITVSLTKTPIQCRNLITEKEK